MLTLPIKRKWFDMIESGEKKEEYREITPYYEARLGKYMKEGLFQIILRAGYRKNSPKMSCIVWLNKGTGRQEWGAEPGKMYFILRVYDRKRLF
jgi:hypothetical protein